MISPLAPVSALVLIDCRAEAAALLESSFLQEFADKAAMKKTTRLESPFTIPGLVNFVARCQCFSLLKRYILVDEPCLSRRPILFS